jgi:hypothetical protein
MLVAMAQAPANPAWVAAGLELVEGGMSPEEAAAELKRLGTPISWRTLRRAGATAQGVQRPPEAAPTRQAATKPAKGPPRASNGPSTNASRSASRERELDVDPVVELQKSWNAIKAQVRAADGPRGLAGLVGAELAIAKTIIAIQKGRETAGSEVAAVLAKGAATVAKVRQGVAAVARREAEQGTCCRCGAALPADIIVRRRAEAGLDAAAVH